MASAPRDVLGQLVGDADAVRDAFEQMPVVLVALSGPDHRIVATNAAYRAFTGGPDGVIGMSYREAFPEIGGSSSTSCSTGCTRPGAETGKEWRAQIDRGPDGIQEVYADFTVAPRRAADGDGAVNGLLIP